MTVSTPNAPPAPAYLWTLPPPDYTAISERDPVLYLKCDEADGVPRRQQREPAAITFERYAEIIQSPPKKAQALI